MKKVVVIASGLLSFGYLGAEMPAFNLDTSVKFSTEYIFRGYMRGKKVFAPKVELNAAAFENARVYIGTNAVLALDHMNDPDGVPLTRSEIAPYIGVSYDATDLFTLDLGYMNRFYINLPVKITRVGAEEPSNLNQRRNVNEIYAGLMVDVLLSPSVYAFYNFGSREFTVEGCTTYTYDLAQFGANNAAIELGAKVGYGKADRPYASSTYNKDTWGKKGYFYYGANADLVYILGECAKARAGVAVGGNNADKKKDWPNHYIHRRTFVWFNASVDCSF
jgi:hypothetical protein